MRVIAHHGTAARFDRFVRSSNDHPSAVGIWLASAPNVARAFALASRRMVDDVSRVVTVEFDVVRPLTFSTYADFLLRYRNDRCDVKLLRRRLMRADHDAIIIERSDTDGHGLRTDYAVLRPKMIRIVSTQMVHGEGKTE